MSQLLVICGPTATGKTSLAIKLAKSALGGNGEIVSADSRQVYKGMDVGTGKDLPVSAKLKTKNSKLQLKTKNFAIGYYEVEGIRIWLYDIVKPDYQFNVADYVECAQRVIEDIWKRGKLPILVGGTGFYIKAIVDGIETLGIKPDWGLRKILGHQDIKILREKLEKLDVERLERMNESDRNNPRRLIRAIEVATKVQRCKGAKVQSTKLEVDDSLMIGLTTENKKLYERIDKRVDERIAMGVEKEIRQSLKKGCSFENSVLGTTIGYKEWQPRFSNIPARLASQREAGRQYPISNITQRWKYDEHGYARRQITWFKKIPKIEWFDISRKGYANKIVESAKKWYDK